MRSDLSALLAPSGIRFCMSKCLSCFNSAVLCLACLPQYFSLFQMQQVGSSLWKHVPEASSKMWVYGNRCLLKVIRTPIASCLGRMEITGLVAVNTVSICLKQMETNNLLLLILTVEVAFTMHTSFKSVFNCVLKVLQSYEF